MAPLSNTDAAERAACILRIHVLDSTSDQSGHPITVVRARVVDIFKCVSDLVIGDEVAISAPGGRSLGRRQVVLGLDRGFRQGRDYVVFLPVVPERAHSQALRINQGLHPAAPTLWNSYEVIRPQGDRGEEYVVRSGSLGIARRQMAQRSISFEHDAGRVRYEDLVSEILRGL